MHKQQFPQLSNISFLVILKKVNFFFPFAVFCSQFRKSLIQRKAFVQNLKGFIVFSIFNAVINKVDSYIR